MSLRSSFPKGLLDEAATQKLFTAYSLPLPAQALAKSAEEAVKIAWMMHECPEILELDLNPVLVGNEGIVIADAKVIV